MMRLDYVLTGFVAVLHVYFLILEMFLWDKPFGMKTFGMSEQKAKDTKVLAANQGLYNGFLAAGLLWSNYLGDEHNGINIRIFFLMCVIIAGSFGAMTFKPKIFFVQAVPAILALLSVYISM